VLCRFDEETSSWDDATDFIFHEANCSADKFFSLAPVFPPVGQCDVMKRYFQCNDGRCLPRDQVCDISRDCPDGEDEDQDCGKILFGL
jgi:hypothetical protein